MLTQFVNLNQNFDTFTSKLNNFHPKIQHVDLVKPKCQHNFSLKSKILTLLPQNCTILTGKTEMLTQFVNLNQILTLLPQN